MTPDVDRMLADAAIAELRPEGEATRRLAGHVRDLAKALTVANLRIAGADENIRTLAEALGAAEAEHDRLHACYGNLLARIFRDGGHRQNAIDDDQKAGAEAEAAVVAMLAERDCLQARVAALVTAGTVVSNAAYALSQQAGVPLEPGYCDHLRQLQRDWEAVAFSETVKEPPGIQVLRDRVAALKRAAGPLALYPQLYTGSPEWTDDKIVPVLLGELRRLADEVRGKEEGDA